MRIIVKLSREEQDILQLYKRAILSSLFREQMRYLFVYD